MTTPAGHPGWTPPPPPPPHHPSPTPPPSGNTAWQGHQQPYGQQQFPPPDKKAAKRAKKQASKGHTSGRRRLVLLAAAVGLVGATVVVTLLASGSLTGSDLDKTAVQKGVQTVLTTNYGIGDATSVVCPAGVSATKGTTFTCTVEIGSLQQTVPVTVLNDTGQYQVGAPG